MTILSVVMPVYNADKYLDDSILSILGQTYFDFKFYIINDGSTDLSLNIIKEYEQLDNRVILINQKNIGYTRSLIKVISKVKTKYVARMDADDIAHPKRFEYQIEYLKKNPKIKAVGTAINLIDERNNVYGYKFFNSNSFDILNSINFETPIAHPSVMFEREIYDKIGGYDKNFEPAEDYQLWIKFIKKGYFIDNIRKKLLNYRVHDSSVTNKRAKQQINNTIRARRFFFDGDKKELKLNFVEKKYFKLVTEKKFFENLKNKNLRKFLNYKTEHEYDERLQLYLIIKILIYKIKKIKIIEIFKISIFLFFKNLGKSLSIIKILSKSRFSFKQFF